MFERSWVQIPAPYTGRTCFHIELLQKCIVCLKILKINEKEAEIGPFFKK